eukprot:TRINITY_DN25053_c0_g1_i1.p1 TRINITY_DN25053_c0_g1~~TRINITY_DN25053_c0_g1_i1.p1  ORF type:complete len:111 (+),score=33.40 TRINITY_DN25053_c0_g1_i1:241-573(+)
MLTFAGLWVLSLLVIMVRSFSVKPDLFDYDGSSKTIQVWPTVSALNSTVCPSYAYGRTLTFEHMVDKDFWFGAEYFCCLLYTSDAADEEDSVDLGGRRIIKKKKIDKKVG